MTPAITAAKRAKIKFQIHQYQHDASATSYGEEAADKLGLSHQQVFKTLVVAIGDKQLAVGVVPVSAQLDLKAFAKALPAKKVQMAQPADAERSTGYVLGGVSPLGQKRLLPTVIDASAAQFTTLFVSAGRRGMEIELSADDLCQLTKGKLAEIAK